MSDQAADPRSVRPRPETPALAGFLRCPDLLQGRPVIGGPLQPVDPTAVPLLEGQAHLEAAPVRAADVVPGALVVVDAHPLAHMRRVLGQPVGLQVTLLPDANRALEIADGHP